MPSVNLSFRAPAILLNLIQARDPKSLKNPGSVAKRDVERWYAALADALRGVQLNPAEAVLLIRLVSAAEEPTEAFVDGLAGYVLGRPLDGFDHVRRSLVRKLSAYDRLTTWALVDAAERYVVYQAKHPEATIGMALHQVGLHSYTATPEELASMESTPAGDLKPFGSET
jgi:hypothetical protein